jgi:hypothetical protein
VTVCVGCTSRLRWTHRVNSGNGWCFGGGLASSKVSRVAERKDAPGRLGQRQLLQGCVMTLCLPIQQPYAHRCSHALRPPHSRLRGPLCPPPRCPPPRWGTGSCSCHTLHTRGGTAGVHAEIPTQGCRKGEGGRGGCTSAPSTAHPARPTCPPPRPMRPVAPALPAGPPLPPPPLVPPAPPQRARPPRPPPRLQAAAAPPLG